MYLWLPGSRFFTKSISNSYIRKDNSTNLYSLSLYLKTPLQVTNLHLDLGASLTWADCTRRYKSSSYQWRSQDFRREGSKYKKHLLYNDTLCIALETGIYGNCYKKPGPGCSNDSCNYFPENSVTHEPYVKVLLSEELALPTTDGQNPCKLELIKDFVLSCANTKLLRGLPKGVTGVAALGRFNYSLPFQLSRAFSSLAIFAVCLPSSTNSNGVAFFNTAGPYYLQPRIDVSKSLIYTPMLLNPYVGTVILSYRYSSNDEYFIGVSSMKINGKSVPLNQTLLKINKENGYGGTKISTSTPHTVLWTEMFKVVTEKFVAEAKAMNLTVTTPVKPFDVCFPAKLIATTRVGPAVPTIDLVLHKQDVFWRIFGSNSMVRVKAQNVDVWCLGFVDGGLEPRTSIVIGGHQIEDNLLQFDLAKKRVGFSSSLLFRSTNCANFNFSSSKN
ncbi:probable aspartic proteinase GIP1 [Lycium ferocissimum]|uniref:probable aspartic proteinase GIP1 n=1 Tax=Lycium ferocissimum TaxID=112874 RepID=UPI002816947A|nr:probable aspartic proteinase GIP1 [Lycium ferocissimum]